MKGQTKTPQEVLILFKKILKEASVTFDRPMADISISQFAIASAGRLGVQSMARCGGFGKLKDYVAPKTGESSKATVDMLKRILGK